MSADLGRLARLLGNVLTNLELTVIEPRPPGQARFVMQTAANHIREAMTIVDQLIADEDQDKHQEGGGQ